MVNPGPSTGHSELPDAPPAVPKTIEATGDSVVAPLREVDRPSVSESAEISGVSAKVPVDATLKRIWNQLGGNIHDDGGIVEEIAFRE